MHQVSAKKPLSFYFTIRRFGWTRHSRARVAAKWSARIRGTLHLLCATCNTRNHKLGALPPTNRHKRLLPSRLTTLSVLVFVSRGGLWHIMLHLDFSGGRQNTDRGKHGSRTTETLGTGWDIISFSKGVFMREEDQPLAFVHRTWCQDELSSRTQSKTFKNYKSPGTTGSLFHVTACKNGRKLISNGASRMRLFPSPDL